MKRKMHNQSYYVHIIRWPWLGISIPITLIAVLWTIVNWRYGRGSKAMEAITKLAFPTIFSEHIVADHIDAHTDEDRQIRVEVKSYRKVACFEGREIQKEEFGFKLYRKMFAVASFLFTGALFTFLNLLLLKITYDCDEEDFSKDCFLVGSPLSSPPLNCSSDVNATTEVVCYRRVFDLSLAAGVTYGLFKLATFMCHIVALVIIAFVESRCCSRSKTAKAWCARVIGMLVFYTPVILLVVPNWRYRIPSEISYKAIYSLITTVYFVVAIPWNEIVDRNNLKEPCASDSNQDRYMQLPPA